MPFLTNQQETECIFGGPGPLLKKKRLGQVSCESFESRGRPTCCKTSTCGWRSLAGPDLKSRGVNCASTPNGLKDSTCFSAIDPFPADMPVCSFWVQQPTGKVPRLAQSRPQMVIAFRVEVSSLSRNFRGKGYVANMATLNMNFHLTRKGSQKACPFVGIPQEVAPKP